MHLSILDWNPDRRRPGPGSSLRGQRRPVLWEYSWSSDSAHRQPPGPDHGLLSLPRQDRGRAHRLSHGHQTVWSNQLGKYCFYKWMWMNYCQDLLKPSLSLKSFILIHNPTFLEAQSPFILNFQLWGFGAWHYWFLSIVLSSLSCSGVDRTATLRIQSRLWSSDPNSRISTKE